MKSVLSHGCVFLRRQVCNAFKSCFAEYKERAESEATPWNIKTDVVLLRLIAYIERNMALTEVTTTVQQFSKLEKIEICGTKGKKAQH